MPPQRTRAQEALRHVRDLREAICDLDRCEIAIRSGREPGIAAIGAEPRHTITIEIVVHDPEEAAP